MKYSALVAEKINKLPKGYVFTYKEFLMQERKREAVIKYLNRMAVAGKISKLSKGKYYKSQKTRFGDLLPEQRQIIKDLIREKENVAGYITGYSYFNSIGLTTQISNVIQIAKNETRPAIRRGSFKIVFIKQKNLINKENIPLLRKLDTLRFIKKIPDTNIESSCIVLKKILKNLNNDELVLIQRLALKYPPSTRALLGALLESNKQKVAESLKKSLNPITQYNFGISRKVLPTIDNWEIV